MEVFFYQAECGDAARIRFYDNHNNPRNVLIDSGYARTFKHVIKDDIEKLIRNNEKIDICLISHIHDDHMGGIIKYIKTIKTGEINDIIDNWFYNPPRIYKFSRMINQEDLISYPASISQGDDLFEYISSRGKLLDYDISNDIEQINLGSLKMTILSPSKRKLSILREKYKSERTCFESIENESISDAVSFGYSDYGTRIEDFNFTKFEEDESIENGSSIAVLSEYKNIRVLWLSDSHPTDIVKSLKHLGYSNENKVACDLVKVSHHGSAYNTSSGLYNLIDCTKYLFSVNGENKHDLPNKESIVRILRNQNRDFEKEYIFYFTYDNSTLRSIFKVDGEKVFNKWNFKVEYNSDKRIQFKL